jgi:D-glycero-D-manno-heptose 1,7-bisphosphate phosphatase
LNERKPGTVLFERTAERFNIDFRKSFMAGDKASDITPALKLGMTPFLVSSRFTNIELLSWAFNNNVVFFPTINEAVQKVFK